MGYMSRSRIVFRDDRLPLPAGVDRWAVLRALDAERLSEEAPDVQPARRARIVKIRDAIRRGAYVTEERLRAALERALDEIARGGGTSAAGRAPRRRLDS